MRPRHYQKGMLYMTIYNQFAGLLRDIESFSKQREFPEAEKLIWKARQAMRKDQRNQVNNLSNVRNPKPETNNLRHH